MHDVINNAESGSRTSNEPLGPGKWFSTRYLMVYLGFLGMTITYALRQNFTVTILSMITESSSNLVSNTSHIKTDCLNDHSTSSSMRLVQEKINPGTKFNWTESQQGLFMAGAFYAGNAAFQIPGGYLSVNPKTSLKNDIIISKRQFTIYNST